MKRLMTCILVPHITSAAVDDDKIMHSILLVDCVSYKGTIMHWTATVAACPVYVNLASTADTCNSRLNKIATQSDKT